MARTFPSSIQNNAQGILSLEILQEIKRVYYIPNEEGGSIGDVQSKPIKWKLLEINLISGNLSIYPFRNDYEDFFLPKYNEIEIIVLSGFDFQDVNSSEDVEELLNELPTAFVKDYNYGLGLKKEYSCIISMLENLNVKHLTISVDEKTSINEIVGSSVINYHEFEKIRKSINRIHTNARAIANEVKQGNCYNHMAYFLKDSKKYPQKGLSVNPSLIAKLFLQTLPKISDEENTNAIQTIKRNASKIAKESPETIVKLRNDLELVSLEQLIEKFESMLFKKLKEDDWQNLLNENPFILTLAFGYPIIKIQNQASVGGRTIAGGGDKIADFLTKNSISNNAALFEIKTPTTKLLNANTYRDGVYTPSKDLSGAINQLLDQKHKFEKSIPTIKDNSRIHDLESYSVHGILIIGQTPPDPDQQKSFELARGNSKNVTIITFNELLEKLKQLLDFLSTTKP